jgi:uncharacterized membrane protein
VTVTRLGFIVLNFYERFAHVALVLRNPKNLQKGVAVGIKILYAGDSPVGGAANYLLGILGFMKAKVTHIPPAEILSPGLFKSRYDVIIFSDYSRRQLSAACENLVLTQVEQGSGFLMIGGWGSYSGPFGGWRGSRIEEMLPVQCNKGDDRTNFPGGATVKFKNDGGFLNPEWFHYSPAICGMNLVRQKKNSKTLLSAKKILSNGKKLRFDSVEYPLLIIDSDPGKRIAALTTDLAPHWCGGLVDWGKKTLKLSVTPQIQVQIGDYYVYFAASLLHWLARQK